MHRSTASSNGGLFKGGGIFGGSKTATSTRRPSTSSGHPTTHSESLSAGSSRTSAFSRKTSFSSSSTSKSPKATHRSRNDSTAIPTTSPERLRLANSSTQHTDGNPLPATAAVRQDSSEYQPKSVDSFQRIVASAERAQSPPASGTESFTSTTPYANMLVRPVTGYQAAGANGAPTFIPIQPPSPTLETITYQHIQETSSKRISTLDYLRKAYVVRSSP